MIKSLIITLTILLSAVSLSAAKRTNSSVHSAESKFIFYAVLEGLYEDGLKDDAVKAIMGNEFYENFIYACPICHSTYHAFQVYSSRPVLMGLKKETRDFGDGLAKEERAILLGDDDLARRKQIRTLVSRWIERRVKSQNLDDEAKATLREKLKKMSEKGTQALERWQQEWKQGKKTMAKVENQLKTAGIKAGKIHNILYHMRNEYLGRHYENWEFCPSCEGVTLKK